MLFKGNSSSLQQIIDKIHNTKDYKSTKDTLGSDGGCSSWGSEDNTTSPGSSCATPNSATEVAESELSFTVGVTDATPHACRFCEKAFSRHSYLKKHEQTHADCMPFRCEYCRRLFKHKRSRDRHIKLHTGDKKYRCSQCDAAFSRSDHLKIHMKTHDNQKPFQCTVCNRGYNTAAALTSHLQNHKKTAENPPTSPPVPGTTFKCLQCTDVFRKPEDLQSHMDTHPQLENNQSNSGRSSKSSYSATRISCNYCSKDNFSTADSLQSHMQTAHKAIMNGDVSAGKSYSKSNSSTHVPPSPPLSTNNAFSVISPYYCELCTMRFSSGHALQKHCNTVHRPFKQDATTNNNGKLYCVYCAMHFITPASLAEHFVIFHNPYHQQFLNLSPSEQIKPTDLSLNRKSPVKRPLHEEHRSSPKKKIRIPDEIKIPYNQHTSPNYEYPGTLLCSQCNAAFLDFESFRSHIKQHIEETSNGGLLGGAGSGSIIPDSFRNSPEFACPHCRSSFTNSHDINQHLASHFLKTTSEFSCEHCSKIFNKPDELQKHLMDIHSQHLFSCTICNEVFDSKVTIQVHFSVRHSVESKIYKCTGCPLNVAAFHSETEFFTHIKNSHTENTSSVSPSHQKIQILRCFICQSNFTSELEMQLHLATHGKQLQCTLCPQSFHIEYLLDKHMQTHQQVNGNHHDHYSETILKHPKSRNGSTPASASPSPRQEHNKLENISNNLNNSNNNNNNNEGDNHQMCCDICERSDFVNESDLMSHKRLTHHVKSSPPPKVSLHCPYCNENYKSRTELENHMKTHSHVTGATGKHKCIICDEMCPTATSLAQHKLTHCKVLTGKSCTQCKGAIANEQQFYTHIQKHSNPNNGVGKNNNNNNNSLILPTGCVICRQTLVSEMETKMHAQFHLQQSSDLASCSVCFQTFERQDIVAGCCKDCYHKQNSSSPLQCNECRLKFESPTEIEIHIATVHRKPYQCIKCQVTFNNEKEVQQHIASHLVIDGRLECRLCRHVFPSPMQLQSHLIEHTFAGCATFTCYLCSSIFTTAQGLQSHIMEHGLSARPYDCPRCKQKFFFTSELEHHSYIHLEEDLITSGYTKNTYQQFQEKMAFIHKQVALNKILTSDKIINEKCNKYECSKCTTEFNTLNDLEIHFNYAHAPKRNEDSNNGENIENGHNMEDTKNVTVKEENVEDEEEEEEAIIDVGDNKSEQS